MLSLQQAHGSVLDKFFWGFSLVVLVSIGSAIAFENYILLLTPAILIGGLISISDYKKIYYLFFAALPFSVEMFFDNGLGTDLPTEPLAILLCGIAIVVFIFNIERVQLKFLRHPISLIILLHLCWIVFACIFSQNQIISLKYFLAKSWYVIPFYFFSLYLLQNRKTLDNTLKVLVFFVTLVLFVIIARHASMGFTFKSINKAAHPMYRNHVIYAGLLVLILPYLWYFYRKAKSHFWWIVLMSIYLIGIYLTYTRAAYVCVLMMVAAYFVIKFRFAKLAVFLSLFAAGIAVNSMIQDNKYLDFAPEYKKTVSHIKFDNLIEATYKLEDVSTMERVYRWVAGLQMVKDRPLLGFGPGCFYSFYKDYVVSSFRTYVSDNPDKSGIHNYFFMILVEQGVLGCILVLFLCIFPVIYGEKVYHALSNKSDKDLVMAAILFLIAFDGMLIINDLIETDKLGSFFWLNLSIIVLMGIKVRQQKEI